MSGDPRIEGQGASRPAQQPERKAPEDTGSKAAKAAAAKEASDAKQTANNNLGAVFADVISACLALYLVIDTVAPKPLVQQMDLSSSALAKVASIAAAHPCMSTASQGAVTVLEGQIQMGQSTLATELKELIAAANQVIQTANIMVKSQTRMDQTVTTGIGSS